MCSIILTKLDYIARSRELHREIVPLKAAAVNPRETSSVESLCFPRAPKYPSDLGCGHSRVEFTNLAFGDGMAVHRPPCEAHVSAEEQHHHACSKSDQFQYRLHLLGEQVIVWFLPILPLRIMLSRPFPNFCP